MPGTLLLETARRAATAIAPRSGGPSCRPSASSGESGRTLRPWRHAV
ncbi:hypothetical protein [Streptomyces litmocidini]